MELTPQQIDAVRTQNEIERQVNHSFAGMMDLNGLEKRALKKHPPVFRQTQPVSPAVRNIGATLAKLKRPVKIKKHVLP